MSEQIEHRGFSIDVHQYGPGWRVRIYPPGDAAPMLEIPETQLGNGRDQVIREAQAIVDRRIAIFPSRATAIAPVPRPAPARRWRHALGIGRKGH